MPRQGLFRNARSGRRAVQVAFDFLESKNLTNNLSYQDLYLPAGPSQTSPPVEVAASPPRRSSVGVPAAPLGVGGRFAPVPGQAWSTEPGPSAVTPTAAFTIDFPPAGKAAAPATFAIPARTRVAIFGASTPSDRPAGSAQPGGAEPTQTYGGSAGTGVEFASTPPATPSVRGVSAESAPGYPVVVPASTSTTPSATHSSNLAAQAGPPPILYIADGNVNGDNTLYVGSNISLDVGAPDNTAGHQIRSYYLKSVTGVPVYGGQSIGTDRSGGNNTFTNEPLIYANAFEERYGLYFGTTPGTATLTVEATYADGTVGTVVRNLTVVGPPSVSVDISGEITLEDNAPANIFNGRVQLSRQDPTSPIGFTNTINWKIKKDDPSQAGVFAVVQIITGDTIGVIANNPVGARYQGPSGTVNGVEVYAPYPLADNDPNNYPFYNAPAVSAVGNDTPNVVADASVHSVFDDTQFTDYLMFAGPNGIWVPYKTWTWSMNITAQTEIINGVPTLTPLNGGASLGPVTNNNSTYPSWIDQSQYYHDLIRVA